MNARLLLPTLVLLAAPMAFAQDGPPSGGPGQMPMHGPGMMHHEDDHRHGDMGGGGFGMWWKNPEVATRIGLTADQQKKMEDIFIQSRVQLIDLHASLEKEQLLLEPLMNANPIDQARAAAQIDKIADTRASLEKTNAKMLLSIRGVLTPEQWTKLRERHADWHHGDHGPADAHRGPGGPGGPRWNHQPPTQQKAPAPAAPPAQ